MAKGIDIYRYQTVTDWRKVRDSGVAFVWVKLTDGLGPAIVKGDTHCRGAKSVGIPVGGYHFAQKGNPRSQARVFIGELNRLQAWGIIPALDIENNTGLSWTGDEAHNFAMEFLTELRTVAPRVALYANTSELKAMRANDLRIDGLVIWEANYGSNNGTRNSLPANAWAPKRGVHQFTSKGRVPGINENTDINESFVDLRLVQEDGMGNVRFWQEAGGPFNDGAAGWVTITAEEAVGWIHNYTQGTANTVARLEAKLDLNSGRLSEMEINILTAVRENGVRVDMTTEQMLSLRAGLSDDSRRALREVLGSLDEEEN